jgi:hypothetical protein
MGHWRSMTALCALILAESTSHRQISLLAHPVVASAVYADVADRLKRRGGQAYSTKKLRQLQLIACPTTSNLGEFKPSYEAYSELASEMGNAFPEVWAALHAAGGQGNDHHFDSTLQPTLLMTDMLGLDMSKHVRQWEKKKEDSSSTNQEFPIVMWWSTFVCRLYQHVSETDLIGSATWTHKVLQGVESSTDSKIIDTLLCDTFSSPPDDGMRVIYTPGIIEPLFEHEYSPIGLIPPPKLMQTVSGARTQALETCTAVVCATSSALEPLPVQGVRDILAKRGKKVFGVGLLMPTLDLARDDQVPNSISEKENYRDEESKRDSIAKEQRTCCGCCTKDNCILRPERNGSEKGKRQHCASRAKLIQKEEKKKKHSEVVIASQNEEEEEKGSAVAFMNSSLRNHGPGTVMLISFGSVVFPTLPGAAETMLDTLLSSWEAENPSDRIPFVFATGAPMFTNDPGLMSRLHIARTRGQCFFDKWIPQQQVLQHAAMGTFVSHCGYNSTVESIAAGVPIIAVPLTGDQPVAAAYQSQTLNIAWELLSLKAKVSYRAQSKEKALESLSEEMIRIFHKESRPKAPEYREKRNAIIALRERMEQDVRCGAGREDFEKLMELS